MNEASGARELESDPRLDRRVKERLNDPEVLKTIRDILADLGRQPARPGVAPEELPDFLDEQRRRAVDARSRAAD